jgi:hypothetical protein
MIGLTFAFFAFSWNSQAACRLPWSVLDPVGPVEERELRMAVEMDERHCG